MPLKILETFSGIGAQNKAITRLNKNLKKDFFQVVATSDWDIRANIAYDSIHKKEYEVPRVSFDKKINYLSKFIWSWDGKKPISEKSFRKLNSKIIEKLFDSVKGHKNYGSIIELDANKIVENHGHINILTYSFPCQNLSIAGAFHGVNKGMKKDGGTRSGLLWQIERILLGLEKYKKLPKYLILENVKSIMYKNNQEDFKKWLNFLEGLGYKNSAPAILDARDFGIPQSRKRAFVLSVLNAKEKPNISNFNKIKTKPLKNFIDFNNKFKDENDNFVPNDTPSRQKIREDNPIIHKDSCYVRTITTKQDRNPNAGVIEYQNNIKAKSKYRFLSPRETYKLMGFDSKDFDSANVFPQTPSSLYKQAGNSIVVNVLESIFQKIYEIEKGNK